MPMPKMPMAAPRRSGGNTWKTMIMASGWTMPAAAPWMTRARMRTFSSGASPPRTEPPMNVASAARMLSRWPNARSAQSVSSMVAVMAARKPVESHCALT
jgi:hypothetical protein